MRHSPRLLHSNQIERSAFCFLGWLFGGMYAQWCVRQMLGGIVREFVVPGVEN